MKVFTYYTPIPGKFDADERALIDVWRASWQARGWEAEVLGVADVPDDADARRLLKAFAKQPTQMKPGLAYSWFVRWLAVAARGGGFMTDYDVINYAFAPRAAGALTIYERHVPCLVSGTRDEFLRMCGIFAAYQADTLDRVGWRRDTSDMKILIRNPGAYEQARDCVEYALSGWENASAVHFSNFAMKPRGFLPRHAHIAQLRAFV